MISFLAGLGLMMFWSIMSGGLDMHTICRVAPIWLAVFYSISQSGDYKFNFTIRKILK